ncbi:MAG: hypothetical protein AAFY64_09305 [Pseudomonadota bacterium]
MTRTLSIFGVAAVVATVLTAPDVFAHGVHAHTSPAPDATYSVPADASWWEAMSGQVQHNIAQLLGTARDTGGVGTYLTILVAAFGYGILHAVGPGHGKLILASYMTATRASAPLGISIALAAAALQAAIAIGVVLVVAIGSQSAASLVPSLQGAVNALGLVLLAALGLTIVLRQLAALQVLPEPLARAVPALSCGCCSHADHAGDHSHHDEHAHGHRIAHSHDHHEHGHHHAAHACHAHDHNHHHCDHHHNHHHHDHKDSCGSAHGHHSNSDAHAHAAPDKQIAAVGIGSVIASMGSRPCTSAFAILLLALASDMLWLGIFSTLAMAAGVACTLILVAVFSVDIREHGSRLLSSRLVPDGAVGAMNVVVLVAGALLTTIALGGLVQAAT